MIDNEITQNESFSWKDYFKALLYLLDDQKIKYIFYSVVLTLVLFYTVIPPLILGKIVDFFTKYKAGDSLTTFYGLIGFLVTMQIIVSYVRLSTKRKLGDMMSKISYKARIKGFNILMSMSLAWHDSENTGNKFQRIQNGLSQLSTSTRLINNDVFRTITNIIGMTIVLAFIKATYIFLIFIYVIIFALLLKHYYKLISELQNKQNQAIEKASGAYIEGLGNILTLKSSGAGIKFGKSIANIEEIRKQHEILTRKVSIGTWQLFQAFNGIMAGIFLLFVGQDVVTATVSVGSIIILFGYLQQLTSNASDVLDTYDQLILAKSGIGRMMEIYWSNPAPQGGNKLFPQQWSSISLQNAYFEYKKDYEQTIPSLNNINMVIEKNTKIGIVGKTGSGKSTIAKILMGLYQLDSGTYKIGETNFYDINHDYVTDHIAIVLQDSEMFNLSIKENVTLMRTISPELFERAIHISQLESVIDKLPNRLETIIGEKGYHLSGGERQRVGIARAICRDPEIIIFDEATSSLDSQTENKIQSSLENELTKKTMIFIAHRISTLKNTDLIYVFKEGSIAEEGTYQKLLTNRKSLFSQLYSLQEKNV